MQEVSSTQQGTYGEAYHPRALGRYIRYGKTEMNKTKLDRHSMPDDGSFEGKDNPQTCKHYFVSGVCVHCNKKKRVQMTKLKKSKRELYLEKENKQLKEKLVSTSALSIIFNNDNNTK